MPYANGPDARIHYQVVGAGPPLVVQHGFSSSAETLLQLGYAEAMPGRTLILVDARGHGRSDKPQDRAAYDLALRARDVTTVLDDLGLARADFLGYSMGGWIGFGLLLHAPERVVRAALGGAHPFADNAWAAFDQIDPADDDAFIAAFESAIGERFPDEVKPAILDNDRAALVASAGIRADLSGPLMRNAVPTLLYTGDQDARAAEIARAASEVPCAAFRSIPSMTHADAYMRPDLVAETIRSFLDAPAPEPEDLARQAL